MKKITYTWKTDHSDRALDLVHGEGTAGRPYLFGEGEVRRAIEVAGFYIATVPVTQALWTHVMGAGNNPSIRRGDSRPVENVSWDGCIGFRLALAVLTLALGIGANSAAFQCFEGGTQSGGRSSRV